MANTEVRELRAENQRLRRRVDELIEQIDVLEYQHQYDLYEAHLADLSKE